MYPDDAARRGIDALLRPQSIAVLGASAARPASGNQVIANLRRHRYPHPIHIVHRAASAIDGLPAVGSIGELPGDVDVALVSLPADAVLPALAELDQRGCAAALVPTAGMADEQLAELSRFVSEHNIVIHGPNCMGVLNFSDDIPLWFYDGMLTEEKPGSISLVTQSGSATIFIVRSAETARFAKVISTGNEVGLAIENYLTWLSQDPSTEAVGVVIESIKNPAAFTASVRALREAGKPLVALKVGHTGAGAVATVAHTGALVGRDDVYAALFESLDVPLVADYDELATALDCLADRRLRSLAAPRAGVVTISGGQAALAADLANRHGVELPAFSAATARRLVEVLPGSTPLNPFDAGASVSPEDDSYEKALQIIGDDPGVEVVLVILDAQATLNQREVDYEADLFAGVGGASATCPVPIVVASSSSVSTHARCRRLLGPEVPLLRGIPNALAALRACAANRAPITAAPQRPVWVPSAEVVTRLRAAVRQAAGPLRGELREQVLRAYGLPMVASIVTGDADAAASWAAGRYPVVGKVSSADVAHRSDIGGVVVGIEDDQQLRSAIAQISQNVRQARPSAVIDGYEIQEQLRGLEAMAGFVTDPVFGACVIVGSGGALVELHADVRAAAAPVSPARAAELIGRTKLGAVLSGYRGLAAPTDVARLADLVSRVSWLAADLAPDLAEGDFNPVVVEPASGQVSIADSLLVAAPVMPHQIAPGGSRLLMKEAAPAQADDVVALSVAFQDVPGLAGQEFVGRWLVVDEPRLRSFEHATYLDDNEVQLDPVGYPEGLIEGFHLLGLLDHLVNPVLNVNDGTWFGWNYGLDRVRFVTPVRAGDRMRVRGTVATVESRGDGYLLLIHCTVEIDGRSKPGFVADWRALWAPAPSSRVRQEPVTNAGGQPCPTS
jgi:acetate---CoA ligase (ADP-forming)